MGTHILLNLLNELGKSDKMWGLPNILSLFRNKFNKLNNAWAQMLDSIYHMMLKFVEIGILVWKRQYVAKFTSTCCHIYATL